MILVSSFNINDQDQSVLIYIHTHVSFVSKCSKIINFFKNSNLPDVGVAWKDVYKWFYRKFKRFLEIYLKVLIHKALKIV